MQNSISNADFPRFPIVRRKNYGTWIAAAFAAIVAIYLVIGLAFNPAMNWDVVGAYLFSPLILGGLATTLWIALVVTLVGLVGGLIVALMRVSGNPLLSGLAQSFILVFRAVPALVWLLFWYFIAILVPVISIGIPFGPTFYSANTNDVFGQIGAAIIGLGLVESAYMAEIIRGGILSVGKGQTEASKALGISSARTMFVIVLPQALRSIIPAFANELINILKGTSLLIIIGVPELMTVAQDIYTANFEQIPLLTVVCFWYLVICGLMGVVQNRLEKHINKGTAR
ncbi:polar amino acid transport system permease protein [Neorhizobium galegae]|uniref:amino acid ABC transporter permease n=1 Tax=Neorhizobium galegae TaxID=399 RepID=UPI00277F4B3A|nr:amino acid ABC transporter permease [Neorhizobium galegae]MDQ0137716.1 polar amino acid transport system permease protein [Neorhizobium galegae]